MSESVILKGGGMHSKSGHCTDATMLLGGAGAYEVAALPAFTAGVAITIFCIRSERKSQRKTKHIGRMMRRGPYKGQTRAPNYV